MRQTYLKKKCHTCGEELLCPKCGTPSPSGTNFSNWIRDQPIDLSVQDIDFVIHDYRKNALFTIEEKCYGAKSNKAQMDTHYIIYQMLRKANGMNVKTMRGVRPVEYRGHHTVCFEQTSPLDSAWVAIDGMRYDTDSLINFLKTGKP